MKQKGKTWYTHKGEATLAKYIPVYVQACERIGQKIGTVAEEIEKRLVQAKYDFHKLCMEAYNEYLKTGQPVKRFSFLTFDKMIKVEFDVNDGYIRVYRATKKDPSHKDYELINLDFSGTKPVNGFTEKDVVELVNAGVGGQLKTSEEATSLEFFTLEKVKETCSLIASEEDDPNHFEIRVADIPVGPWVFVMEPQGPNSTDITIRRNKDFFIVNDCGVRSLYMLKTSEKEKEKRLKERSHVPNIPQGVKKYPLTEENSVPVASIIDFGVDGTHYFVTVDSPQKKPKESGIISFEDGVKGFIKKVLTVGENVNPNYYTLELLVVNTNEAEQFNANLKQGAKILLYEPFTLQCLCGQKTTEGCLSDCSNTLNKDDQILKS